MTTLSGEPAMGSIDLPCTTTSSTSLGRCLLWGWLSAIYDFIACLYKCGPDRPQARHNPSPHSAWNTPRCPWTKHQLATSLLLIAKTYPRSASSTTRLRSATPLCSRGFYRHSWWHCSPDRPQARQGPDWSTSIQVDVDSNFYRRLDTGIGPKAHRYSPDRPQAR